jgi:hypothetical protein
MGKYTVVENMFQLPSCRAFRSMHDSSVESAAHAGNPDPPRELSLLSA